MKIKNLAWTILLALIPETSLAAVPCTNFSIPNVGYISFYSDKRFFADYGNYYTQGYWSGGGGRYSIYEQEKCTKSLSECSDYSNSLSLLEENGQYILSINGYEVLVTQVNRQCVFYHSP